MLFATAINIINTLSAAQRTGRLKLEMKKYLKPSLLLIDELGYLPLDKTGADLYDNEGPVTYSVPFLIYFFDDG